MTAYTDFVTAVGTGRLGAFYHRPVSCVASSGNLVTWDDVRGSSGPQLLPNGGAGGTAPTVDANYVITNGVDSYVRHASALSMFDTRTSAARTAVFWGELIDTGNTYWPISIDSDVGADITLLKQVGGKLTTFNGADVSPKAFPASGVMSLIILSIPANYGMSGGSPDGSGNMWGLDHAGRGALIEGHGAYSASTGYLSLGKYSSAFGSMKIRGFMWFTDSISASDRAAIETFLAAVGDPVHLYSESDSTGSLTCIGDSLSYGLQSSAPSTTVPVDTAGTGYPSRLQSLLNKNTPFKIDVINRGIPSMLGTEATNIFAGHTRSYLDDVAGVICSPARRAAGFKDVVIIWFGANDLAGVSAATMETSLAAAVATFKTPGSIVGINTVIPLTGWFGTATETKRLAVNTSLLAGSSGADFVVNLATAQDGATFPFADPVGSDTITTNGTYYNGDGIHLTDLGYQKVGDRVFTAVLAALTKLTSPSPTRFRRAMAVQQRAA